MAVDLLALFNGGKPAEKPGTARSTPSAPSPSDTFETGPVAGQFSVGATFTIKVPVPAPLFTASSGLDPVNFLTPRKLISSGGVYSLETTVTVLSTAGVPPPPPLFNDVPSTFHIASTSAAVTAKTSTDVALNEQLLYALIRKQK